MPQEEAYFVVTVLRGTMHPFRAAEWSREMHGLKLLKTLCLKARKGRTESDLGHVLYGWPL